MSKLVTIFGGSGFLGRQIARIMAAEGWRVRVAVRRPNEAGFVRAMGAVGQVEPVTCNVRNDLSVTAAMTDADAVINCVGILVREGKNSFDMIHDEAAMRVARISAELAIPKLVHISAAGADEDSPSNYAATKGRGEISVLMHRPDAAVLRPSVMFGQGDGLYNKIAGMTRLKLFLFVPGASSRVQPVFVNDVAWVAAMCAAGQAPGGIYELGGPDVMTMREVARQVLDVTGRRRAIIGLPGVVAATFGSALDAAQWMTGGLVTNRVITRDQAVTLRRDNLATPRAGEILGFDDVGIVPTAAAAVIPSYLWRFRPSGQYDAIKQSAKSLRDN